MLSMISWIHNSFSLTLPFLFVPQVFKINLPKIRLFIKYY